MGNAELKLVINRGFAWYCAGGVSFKGYIFADGEMIKELKACSYISELINRSEEPGAELKKINGIYSFIYQNGDETFVSCDRTRTFPLFYREENRSLIISDDPSKLKTHESRISNDSVQAFLHAGYAPGSSTLIGGIFQVQAGEYLIFSSEGLHREFYHCFSSGNFKTDEAALKNELRDTLIRAGKRLSASLEGKTPVLPLSSGYDSRLIAVMLKMNGFDNVMTFTYGRKENYEVELSAKTAEILGYKWTNIEYSQETVKDFIRSEYFLKYYPFSSNYTSMFFLQEFFAVEKLKEIIPENSVFIPGHSGDSVAGSHIREKMTGLFPKDILISFIMSGHFVYKKISEASAVRLREIIGQTIPDKKEYSHQDYQNWIIKERHAKFIINSNRIYEFFGFEHRMPLVDSEFMDIMENAPFSLKFGKKLYDDVLREYFFEPYGLNFSGETNPSAKTLMVQDAKNAVRKILPKKIVDIYREKIKTKSDTYFNIGVTDQMINDMKDQKIEPDMSGENRNSVIIQWYIQQLLNERF